eukprot:3094829-Amphidinium_carterae.2
MPRHPSSPAPPESQLPAPDVAWTRSVSPCRVLSGERQHHRDDELSSPYTMSTRVRTQAGPRDTSRQRSPVHCSKTWGP